MLRHVVRSNTGAVLRSAKNPSTVSVRVLSTAGRDYQYFDNFEVKDGVGIVRLNGPGKMNTIY